MKKIFILAGDPSGDIHAARLMTELKKIQPDISFSGIGGTEMSKAGLKSLVPISEISVIGFWEVAKKILLFKKLMSICRSMLETENFDAFIPVDYPGFNLKLAERAKIKGIPVFYYIAPQLWAWGKDRAKALKSRVDKLFVVFPFEVDFFKKFGIESEFVGHPLLDDPEFPDKFPEYDEREFRIALFPGSRKQELARHIPILSESSKLLINKYKNISFGLAASKAVSKDIYTKIISDNSHWVLWDDSRELMKTSLAGIIKTGTSNLEASLCGLPFSMFYKTSPISYRLSKRLINLPYVSIINILSGKAVIKEFIQDEAKPEKIVKHISQLIDNKEYYNGLQNEFYHIKNLLGDKGASKRAAEIILSQL